MHIDDARLETVAVESFDERCDIADESYAVANAIPELKAIATGVLETNDQDAVARWIDAQR